MSRIKRFYSEYSFYFITTRTYHGKPVFDQEANIIILANVIKMLRDELGFGIYAYAIMLDHIHAIIKPKQGNDISTIMRMIKGRSSRWINRLCDCSFGNHIWETRFHDHILRYDKYVQNFIKYIHHNPVKHGLVQKIEDYPWTSEGFIPGKDFRLIELDIMKM